MEGTVSEGGKRDISLIVSISFAFYLVYLVLHGVRALASY